MDTKENTNESLMIVKLVSNCWKIFTEQFI